VTEERPTGVFTRRRDLRAAPLPPPPPETLAAWVRAAPERPSRSRPDLGAGDPATQELELYRPDPALPARQASLDAVALRPERPGDAGAYDRGERARAFMERWSLWAAGLGKPPRDRSGRRRYPGREGLLPPVLLLAAGLGLAGLVGLLTGFLLRSPGGDAAAASAAAPTVTVTQQVTPPTVTETRTRTKTRTVTATAAPVIAPPGTVLQPGSQGPEVAQLQQDLAALGLFQGRPDGSYDEETRASVQAFQGGFGVAGDPPGVAGPATLTALSKAVGRA
jgi:Putative peptidoglycan binding domain